MQGFWKGPSEPAEKRLTQAGPSTRRAPETHSDARTTTNVYGHLLVEDLRSAINSIARPTILPEPPDTQANKRKIAAGATPFAALVLNGPEKRSHRRSDRKNISNHFNPVYASAPGGSRTPDLRIRRTGTSIGQTGVMTGFF